MLVVDVTREEVKGLLEAWLDDWDRCLHALCGRLHEAGRRLGHETVVGVYGDEILCVVVPERPEGVTRGCTFIELHFVGEQGIAGKLARKHRRYEQLGREFWEEYFPEEEEEE